ncbi:thioredoxin-like domain-containing protein [Carboxylicivirga taeanensis]|uniref:thioredoxin-like domain-containing protein n=1 Tax=Carboxylicivirga taeanensis TaxID=1416875 RepID=UPI003F6E3722
MINPAHKLLLVLTCFALSFASCQEQKDTYSIEGQIKGYANGKAYLKKFENNIFVNIDTVEITDGHFQFEGKVKEPQLCRILVEGYKYPIKYFILEPGKLTYHSELSGNFPTVPQIVGTPLQNDFTNYLAKRDSLYRVVRPLSIKLKDSPELKTELNAQIQALHEQMDALTDSIIKQETKTFLGLYLIHNTYLSSGNGPFLQKMLEPYQAAFANHNLYRTIQERIDALMAIAPGQVAPNLNLGALDGSFIDLNDFKGQVVLLDFWASWCAPCRKENPNIVNLYKTYHKEGLEIIGISLDSKKENWQQAIKDDKLEWHHICEFEKWNSPLANRYAVKAIPFTVLIGRDGKIIATGLHGQELHEQVKKALANK